MAKAKAKAKVEGKDLSKVDVVGINERCVLVYFGTSAWAGTKLDRKQTRKLHEDTGARPGSGRVTKTLMPGCKELATLRHLIAEFRQYHWDHTTAYGRDGWSLLNSLHLPEYRKTFLDYSDKIQTALSAFLDVYPRAIIEAERDLGGLYDRADYPDPEAMKDKWGFTCDMRRLRESQSSLLGVTDELLQEMQAAQDARIREGLASSIQDVVARITETVGQVKEIAAKKAAGEVTRVHDSLIDNVKALADALPSLNITEDPAIAAAAAKLREGLGDITAEQIREDKGKAKEAADAADSVLKDLAAVF